MTERQDREYEKLVTLEDYIELIKSLDELAGDVANGQVVDKEIMKSIACVSKAMTKKVKYIVNFSKEFRRKQSRWSLRRDRQLEREAEEQEEELERLEKEFETNLTKNASKTMLNQSETGSQKVLECDETELEVIDDPKCEAETPSNEEFDEMNPWGTDV